jgi:starch synthase (maltosyl-transferring)
MAQATHMSLEPKRSSVSHESSLLPAERPSSILIEDLAPVISGGRHRAKRCVGDSVTVTATIFCAGHDLLGAAVRYRPPGLARWREAPLEQTSTERFEGVFSVSQPGYWGWQVVAWTDRFATGRD